MTLTTQFYTMLSMIGMGALFGASLDTYHRFLNRSQRKRWFVFINDVMFWVLQALAMFYILFVVNFGEIRVYIFVALLCGFAAYQALFKTLYTNLLEKLILFTISFYRFLVKMGQKLIYSPVKWIIFMILAVVLWILKTVYAVIRFVFRTAWRIVYGVLKVALAPIWWIFRTIWKLLPNHLTKRVDKLYNKMAGIMKSNGKKVYTWIRKWTIKKNKK
ncbi:spore cortex biosynthesis protein YabQ [Rossellomorea marisflavi]|uniref:Spore cortex biosynthesis protein YabQ n=1 Tax=Rossellomorea marisflavi TaxID=189381 RepID=A0A5D4R9E6_9BACI|nr:spore cortex biosynthesis protein YabQ [Rossellomorea marisflavi]TYS47250.1 spore cortex biosynthesis protein YabQ [Rossellomorea marisflavi]WJV18868.1 spore cortex biosynthesis protein YabQ [Rossellomorea marisflavi]